MAGEHAIHHHAERVDVDAVIDRLSGGLLGRHIFRGPRGPLREPSLGRRGVAQVERVAQDLGDAEVEQLDGGEAGAAGLGDEEHVAGLDVAVNDAVLVRAGEGLADLGDDRHHLLPGDRAGLAVDPLAEGLALEQLHDEVDEAVVAAEVGDIDELRVADPGGAEGLLAEAGDVVLDMRKLRV